MANTYLTQMLSGGQVCQPGDQMLVSRLDTRTAALLPGVFYEYFTGYHHIMI